MDSKSLYRLMSAKGKLIIAEKRASGETMHLAPIGYRNVRRHGRSLTERDPVTYSLVLACHRLRAKGASIRKVCEMAEVIGLKSKRGKRIGPSSMLKILRRCLQEV